MAKLNKYQVTNLDTFKIDTESQSFDVQISVDSLDFVTIKFGESFSVRVNYNDAEKLEHVIRDALHVIQDNTIDRAGMPVTEYDNWNPSDPSNW